MSPRLNIHGNLLLKCFPAPCLSVIIAHFMHLPFLSVFFFYVKVFYSCLVVPDYQLSSSESTTRSKDSELTELHCGVAGLGHPCSIAH